MADLITIATTAALTQFVGPTAKHLGEQALARAKQVASQASAYLAAAGRAPQPVEPKLLVPLVQGAGLETDPTLAELWAALLANAADPEQNRKVHPSYAGILRELTSADAQLLQFIYATHPPGEGEEFRHVPTIQDAFTKLNNDLEISLVNLYRLGLYSLESGALFGSDNDYNISQKFLVNHYGASFLAAVTPPTP